MRLSKKLMATFDSMAQERLMAIFDEKSLWDKLAVSMKVKKDGTQEGRYTLGDCHSHVHASIWNGLVKAYTMGRADTKAKRRKK